MRERRLVRVVITSDLLFEWLTQGNEFFGVVVTKKGLPKDAEFVSSCFDDRTMQAHLVFSHPSFEPVLVGHEIPYFEIQFVRHYEPEADKIYRESMRSNEVVAA